MNIAHAWSCVRCKISTLCFFGATQSSERHESICYSGNRFGKYWTSSCLYLRDLGSQQHWNRLYSGIFVEETKLSNIELGKEGRCIGLIKKKVIYIYKRISMRDYIKIQGRYAMKAEWSI